MCSEACRMLTFESLLVKELQKQQSRAELCDIVLHTQVHSCVLSAFSPWLRGALSTVPSSGQKRLIEIQAKEACTLLSLVTLLYSGQFNEDKDEVLSVACKLGINIPQQDTTAGSKSHLCKAESGSQTGTQTEHTKELVERECQTEILCTATLTLTSECPKDTVETVNVIDLSSWRSHQGLDPYSTLSDITLTTLVQGGPEKLPFCQVMDGVPETSMYPTVSALACAAQGYACPPESWCAPPPPQTHPCYGTQPSGSQGQSTLGAIMQGEEYDLEGLEEFQNNIPGFINCFLKANSTRGTRQTEQSQRGMRGDVKTGLTAKRARRGRPTGNCAFKSEGWSIRTIEQHVHRFGRVACSVRIGQGGGRVGRMLDTRHVLKHQGRLKRRQARGASYEVEGKTGRASTRGRAKKRQAESRFVEPEGQDEAPPIKGRRGRPPKCPLPRNSAQRKMSSSEQKASNPPAAFLMHTAALPAANQTALVQPLDWLIDDVIAQLPLVPPITSGIQEGFMSTDSQPRQQTSTKIADLRMVQPQPEGELTDILDSFLRTFDQHMGACDSEVRDGMAGGSQSKVPDKTTDAYQHSAQNYAAHGTSGKHTRNERDLFRGSSVNTTTPLGPTASSHKRRKVSANRPSSSCEASGVNVKKLKGRQSEESENRRMTRSQCQNRELEYTEEGREELSAQKRRRVNEERLEKQGVETSLENEKKKQLRDMCSDKKGNSCKIDSNCSITNTLRKVMRRPSACSLKPKKDRSQSSEPQGHKESGLVNNNAKTYRAKKLDKSTKNTFIDSHPETDLTAIEMMKNLFENGRKKELQNNDDHRSWIAESQIQRERGQEDSSHAKVSSPEDVTLTNFTPMPSASPAMDPSMPLEESGHTQSSTDSSEEDVDVVEISSSLSESSVLQPLVADIVLSTDEDEEDAEIDVLDSN
ncbi:hypothetical protein E1301_Tti004004 [Triplophysa tibetana]|uniref:BTB domain-containing protein n=1 Tax=Triplophysa tibetana TaxID=1572043 RepID=A0A5A9NKX0_9TELE|nr:hypothetical protein E1301_Tti004004 [Triplophysa tibetana]